jgi:hypothetical protein
MVEMNNAEKIVDWLTKNRNQQPICDDHLTVKVGLKNRHNVQCITEALATTPLFERKEGKCFVCGKIRKVISVTWPK